MGSRLQGSRLHEWSILQNPVFEKIWENYVPVFQNWCTSFHPPIITHEQILPNRRDVEILSHGMNHYKVQLEAKVYAMCLHCIHTAQHTTAQQNTAHQRRRRRRRTKIWTAIQATTDASTHYLQIDKKADTFLSPTTKTRLPPTGHHKSSEAQERNCSSHWGGLCHTPCRFETNEASQAL